MAETSRYYILCLCVRSSGVCETDVLDQVEYASKAVENGGTTIGIRCKNGVVLAVEKIITSKLLKPGANKRIASVDRNFGMVSPHEF